MEVGFIEVLGLAVIPYYLSIRDFLNLWPISFDPWSYVIYIGLGYPCIHVVSTKFALFCHYIALFQTILLQYQSLWRLLNLIFISLPSLLWRGEKLYLHRVYSMVFLQLPYLVIYHIFNLINYYVGECHN